MKKVEGRENDEGLFQALARDYVAGAIDIPEITRRMGGREAGWPESRVVLCLEQLGAYRSIDLAQISPGRKQEVLAKLAVICRSKALDKYNGAEQTRREVIASQRIESVYVPSDPD
jgi:hypothetical protein